MRCQVSGFSGVAGEPDPKDKSRMLVQLNDAEFYQRIAEETVRVAQ